MIYRDKHFHNDITVRILGYHDSRANDNTVDTVSTQSLSAMQIYSNTCTQCTCISIVRIDLLTKKLTFLSINTAALAQRLVETVRGYQVTFGS